MYFFFYKSPIDIEPLLFIIDPFINRQFILQPLSVENCMTIHNSDSSQIFWKIALYRTEVV